jgi:hypothetical protein
MIKGEARDDKEVFEFTIESFVTGGFVADPFSAETVARISLGLGFGPPLRRQSKSPRTPQLSYFMAQSFLGKENRSGPSPALGEVYPVHALQSGFIRLNTPLATDRPFHFRNAAGSD